MTDPDIDTLVAFANEISTAIRPSHREVFHQAPSVVNKDDGSPVTTLDTGTEDLLRSLIEARFPDHGILGEERPERNPGAAWRWIIDPIDGTKSFVAGIPLYTLLMALTHEDRFVLGVVEQPILGDRWVGGPETPTRHNGDLVRCRAAARLEDAFIVLGSTEQFGDDVDRIRALSDAVKWTLIGRDSYHAGQLASGRIDALILDSMNLYDYAAMVPVVEGAGGVAIDRHGNRLTLDAPDITIFAANATLGEQIVEVLSR